MVEAGNVLGVLAAVLLLMAVIAWVKLVRAPLLRRRDGTHRDGFALRASSPAELLLWAAGLSSAAAFLADRRVDLQIRVRRFMLI